MRTKVLAGACVLIAIAGAAALYSNYDEWFVFPGLRAHLTRSLRDPAATQFRNERLSKRGVLCGELNAKNGYGGYTGFVRFIATRDPYVEGMDPVGSSSAERISAELEAQRHILKARNEAAAMLLKSGISSPAADMTAVREEARKAIFEQKWKEICD